MTKRGNGEGSIYRRSDGRWSGAISYEDRVGSRKRHTEYGKTQKEVRDKLKAARLRLEAGAPVRDAKVTLAAYVAHWNATTLAASDRKDSTKELYAGLARTHLCPAPLGAIGLDRLRPSDVEAFVHAKRQQGKASSTVRQIYTVLRAILDTAVRDELIAKNPAAAVKRPGVEHQEARYLTPDEVRVLVSGFIDDRLRALYLLLLGSGLRRGEALALTWADVDLDGGHVRVRGTLSRVGGALVVSEPKTDKSRRTIALPQPITAELRGHRIRQVEERLHAGSIWQEGGYVFCTQVGTPLDPRNALRSLQAVARRVGLEDVGLHTLRHSAASALISAGVHMKVVQELLGHSSYAITADVYAHVGVTQQRDAADRLGEAFGW